MQILIGLKMGIMLLMVYHLLPELELVLIFMLMCHIQRIQRLWPLEQITQVISIYQVLEDYMVVVANHSVAAGDHFNMDLIESSEKNELF